jgi:hypothetical protein
MTSGLIASTARRILVTEPAPRPGGAGLAGDIAYRVIRSARRRRTIEIAIEAGEVIVRAPARTSDREIAGLVRDRAGWIARQRVGLVGSALIEGCTVPLLGVPLTLRIVPSESPMTHVERDLFELRVALPTGLDEAHQEAATREALTSWLRARAAEVIPQHVERRLEAVGATPRRVIVRDQRRRWGSCAPDGSLRFNWRLVMLDEALIDYVAVHELAHLHQPNHSPAFWRIVADVLPEHRALRRRLREAGRLLPL